MHDPKVSAIRLLIHGWELPSFNTDELRRQTRHAIRHVLEHGIGGLARVAVDFDELAPERPRNPEEAQQWRGPIRNAIDMEFTVTPKVDEETAETVAQAQRMSVSRLVMHVLRAYVEADAHNRWDHRNNGWLRRL